MAYQIPHENIHHVRIDLHSIAIIAIARIALNSTKTIDFGLLSKAC